MVALFERHPSIYYVKTKTCLNSVAEGHFIFRSSSSILTKWSLKVFITLKEEFRRFTSKQIFTQIVAKTLLFKNSMIQSNKQPAKGKRKSDH